MFQNYYLHNQERRAYIRNKYAKFVFPLEEAEWMGLDLNSACTKLQDIEDNTAPIPLKHIFEEKLRRSSDQESLDFGSVEIKQFLQPHKENKWMNLQPLKENKWMNVLRKRF